MLSATFFATAAALLATSGVVSASTGSAIVHNACDFEVYLWSVSDTSSEMTTLPAGEEYTEAYQTNPDGGGISIKVGRESDGSNVTQYEYTLETSDLWYDLSLINGHPFYEWGVSIVPSDSACDSVICPAGEVECAAAYMTPTDNWATASCSTSADTVLLLCSGDTDTSGSASASSVAASAVATASTTTVFSTSSSVEASATSESSSEATSTTESTVEATSTKAATSAKHNHHSHPAVNDAVAATTSAAATTTAAAEDVDVVVHTTFVTHVVTVEARNAAPTAAPAKRQMHRHEHNHVEARRHAHAH